MKQKSPIPYSRVWRRDRTPIWRAGEDTAAATSRLTGKPSEDHGTGRVCAEDDCITRLSRYNPAEKCYLHDDTPFTWQAPRAS